MSGPARVAALALLACSLWPARADNASQEYYTALINVTVQEPGRGAPLTFRIDRGRYGLDSPKAEVRGQVLAPLPLHGGECGPGRAGAGGRGPGAVSGARRPAWWRRGRRLRAGRRGVSFPRSLGSPAGRGSWFPAGRPAAGRGAGADKGGGGGRGAAPGPPWTLQGTSGEARAARDTVRLFSGASGGGGDGRGEERGAFPVAFGSCSAPAGLLLFDA